MLYGFVSKLGETHGPTLAVGAATLAVLLLLGRLAPKVPGPLVAVTLGIVGSVALRLSASTACGCWGRSRRGSRR